jgi:uncharacterized damage-inducible protein DinB
MDLAFIRRLYAYNEWANARYFAAARALSNEALGRPITSSFSSIRDTLGHIVGAEWIWLRRWLGESPTAQPSWTTGATLDELRREMDAVEAARHRFLDGVDATRLTKAVSFRFLSGRAAEASLVTLLVHVVNHSTYHRGQLATLLRQVGATPPSTDLLLFPGAPA